MKTLCIILLTAILVCGCGTAKTSTSTGNEAPAFEVAVVEESEKSEPELEETPIVEEEPEEEHGPWEYWGHPEVDMEFQKNLYYGNYRLWTVYDDEAGTHYVIARTKAVETCKYNEIGAVEERAKEAFLSFADAFKLPLEFERVEPLSCYIAQSNFDVFDYENTGCWGIEQDIMGDVVRISINKEGELERFSLNDTETELGYIPTFLCRAKE